MTKKTQWLRHCPKLPLALAVAASMSTPVHAFQFYLGDVEASIDTTLSAGASWRTQEPNSVLVGQGNGGAAGSVNSDDGNLNFEKHETYTHVRIQQALDEHAHSEDSCVMHDFADISVNDISMRH